MMRCNAFNDKELVMKFLKCNDCLSKTAFRNDRTVVAHAIDSMGAQAGMNNVNKNVNRM